MDTPQNETGNVLKKYGLPIVFAALVPLFTGAAYVTGLAYYQTYLHVFHVPASLVPISTAEHFVYAYYAINLLIQSIFKSFAVVLIAGLIFLFAFQWLLMDSLSSRVDQSRIVISVRRWFARGRRIRAISRLVFLPTAITVVIVYMVLFITVILIIPVELGGTAGRLAAQEDIAAYRRGCNAPLGTRYCNRILESEKELVKGYIIGGSEKHVIVFDRKTSFIFPRGDKTTIAEFAIK